MGMTYKHKIGVHPLQLPVHNLVRVSGGRNVQLFPLGEPWDNKILQPSNTISSTSGSPLKNSFSSSLKTLRVYSFPGSASSAYSGGQQQSSRSPLAASSWLPLTILSEIERTSSMHSFGLGP